MFVILEYCYIFAAIIHNNMNYRKTKWKLKFKKWMENVKPLDSNRLKAFKIVSNSVAHQNVEILWTPSSSAFIESGNTQPTEENRIIILHKDISYSSKNHLDRYKDAEVKIILTKDNVKIINHLYEFDYSYNKYYTDILFKIVDRKILKLRKKLEIAISINKENTFDAVLEKVRTL